MGAGIVAVHSTQRWLVLPSLNPPNALAAHQPPSGNRLAQSSRHK